jgi:hypothetical protein
MTDPQYDLSPDDAVIQMHANLTAMKADPNRKQLTGMTPDDAFDLGYGACLLDYSALTGPKPEEN